MHAIVMYLSRAKGRDEGWGFEAILPFTACAKSPLGFRQSERSKGILLVTVVDNLSADNMSLTAAQMSGKPNVDWHFSRNGFFGKTQSTLAFDRKLGAAACPILNGPHYQEAADYPLKLNLPNAGQAPNGTRRRKLPFGLRQTLKSGRKV